MYNVVFITIDSLRPDFMSVYNSGIETTPFLKKLSKYSIVFNNAIAPGVPTFFCFPSVMTGYLPFEFGFYLGVRDHLPTLAEAFKRSGFRTYAIVADNPALYPSYRYDRGFDLYEYKQRGKTREIFPDSLDNILKKHATTRKIRNVLDILYHSMVAPKIPMNADYVNDVVINLLKKKRSIPFFLWLHYMDVHAPYYSGLEKRLSSKKARDFYLRLKFLFNVNKAVGRMRVEDELILETIKLVYRRAIEYVDEHIEALYNFISEHYPNTLFIITSDHGESFMEHDFFFHEPFHLYDELVRVPLIIHLPNGSGVTVRNSVSLVNIPKTLADICNLKTAFPGRNLISTNEKIEVKPSMDYRSHLNNITEALYACKAPHIRLGIFNNKKRIEGFYPIISYRTARYKYIINLKTGIEELYDLEKDPKEKHNLISEANKNSLLNFLTIARRVTSSLIQSRKRMHTISKRLSRIKHKLKMQ